jgi:hypothetical protein
MPVRLSAGDAMRYGISTRAILFAVLLCIVPVSTHATTWASSKVRDPITNERLEVHAPSSSGSYIYEWPEKSDQVFWPYTDTHWLWFNPKSGYIAFGNDFAELDSARRAALKAWLKANFDRDAPPQSRVALLLWAEKVYAVRGMDDDFWCHFYRLMAFETRADTKVSLDYVRKALPLLEKRLGVSAELGRTLETLYLLGEYNRRLGRDVDAKDYLQKLDSLEVDEELSGLKNYLLEIAKEQQASSDDKPLQHDVHGV